MRLLFIFLTAISLGAQVKDLDGKVVSEFIFPGRDIEAIPLLYGRDLIFTRSVSLNGNVAGVFIIDTGSNVSMIDNKVAEELGLSQKLSGLSNIADRRKYRFYKVDSMHLGRLEIKNHIIYGGNISPNYFKFKEKIIGVIGGDILSHFPYTIDYKNLILKIYKREAFKPQGKPFDISLENPLLNMGVYSKANPHSGTPLINVKINGEADLKLLLDTADESAVTVRSQDAVKYKNLAGSYSIPTIFRRPGGSIDQFNALVSSVEVFGGKIAEKERNYILFPRPGYVTLRSQLGARILSQFNLSFDYKKKKIWAHKYEGRRVIRDSTDFAGHTETARMVRIGRAEEVKKLLEDKANRKFVGIRNETLLMLAVESRSSKMLNMLLKASAADVNFPNAAGTTPLMRASAASEVMMTNSLIDYEAKVNAVDKDNMGPIHYAVMGGSKVVTDILIRSKAKVNSEMGNGMRPLSLAAGEGNLGIFSMLVEGGAEIPYIDKLGRTLLHLAAFGNNPDMIEVILKHKSSPKIDTPDKKGFTPLMIAAEHGRVEAAVKLIEKGASVRAMNPKNFTTALDLALKTKNDALIKVMEEAWVKTQK